MTTVACYMYNAFFYQSSLYVEKSIRQSTPYDII